MFVTLSRSCYQLMIFLGCTLVMVGCSYDNDLGPNELLFASPVQMADLAATVWEEVKERETLIAEGADFDRVLRVTSKIIEAAHQEQDDWAVVILDQEKSVAFALPNRQIAISKGVLGLAQNDDQLAALVSHLVAHINYNHPGERYSQSPLAKNGFTARGIARAYDRDPRAVEEILGLETSDGQWVPYSRAHSLTADKFGIRYMKRAGFDPTEAVAFWTKLAHGAGEVSTQVELHPVDNTRLRRLEQEIQLIGD